MISMGYSKVCGKSGRTQGKAPENRHPHLMLELSTSRHVMLKVSTSPRIIIMSIYTSDLWVKIPILWHRMDNEV